ncbi:MAG: aminopeptidase [Pseudomonadota bacterium]
MAKEHTKADIKKLEKSLKAKPVFVWDQLSADERTETFADAEDYKSFLDAAKTEREAVREIETRVQAAGFEPLGASRTAKGFFASRMNKLAAVIVPGREPVSAGLRLIISHIDAPRLDLKPKPVYEDSDLAFLKTHYYGGIKKYQWMSRPLALHGFVVKDDGRQVNLVLGENEDDPVLTIADLLPHLAQNVQADKKVRDAFPGEKLNLIVGSLPLGDEEVKDRFKLAFLDLLNQKYGLVEEDFLSAEFEAVPAGRARDLGFDRGLIGAYAQDDRICSFTSLKALLQIREPSKTCLALFVDREETGSDGATGAKSRFLEDILADLFEALGQNPTSNALRKALIKTYALSADVNGALDPDYPEVHEKTNAARLGYGPCVTKFTGHRGKYNASEASAEMMGWLRKIFKKDKVLWQSGLLGRIDEGGGGTVAMDLARYGMEIVDCGPAILGMHSPFEIASKADVHMTIKAFGSFFKS